MIITTDDVDGMIQMSPIPCSVSPVDVRFANHKTDDMHIVVTYCTPSLPISYHMIRIWANISTDEICAVQNR